MSTLRVHWRPTTAISYPAGTHKERERGMRDWVLKNNVVCHARGQWSSDITAVTCKRCLRIAAKCRADSEETIRRLLGEPPVTSEIVEETPQ